MGPDVVIVLGSSLAGMNADQVIHNAKAVVVIGIGPTPYDSQSTVRVWGLLDKVLHLLCFKHLKLGKTPNPECVQAGKNWVQRHPSCRYNTPKLMKWMPEKKRNSK